MPETSKASKPGSFNVPAAMKDAFLTAFVMGALALPLAGFRISEQGGGFFAEQRLDWVLIAVAAGFVGRLILSLTRESLFPAIGAPAGAFFGGIGSWLHTNMVLISGLAIVVAIILPFMPFTDRLILDRAIYMLIYVMLGWGLNIVVGLAGLLDLGYVAFYAVGAYSYALLSTHFDLSFWICLPLAGLFAAAFGVILGFPVLRLRGDYLAIVTLGFGEIIRVVLLNWYEVTKGPDGISGIDRPSLFGFMEFTRKPEDGEIAFHQFFDIPYSAEHRMIFLYFLILALALITNFFTLRMRRLPVGRAWEALREDEIACRSLGINPTNVKLSAFAIGAMFAGFAGSFFATRQGFVSPESFTFIESAIILAIVVLGGMGSQIGVVIASFVLVLGPEFIRELQEYRMLAFGGLMVLIMMWRPRGLLAFRDPTLRLHPVKPKGGG